MAELATIARPYAEALFQASQNDLERTASWLEPLAAVAAHRQLLQLAGDPNMRASQLFEVISSILQQPLPPAGAGPSGTCVATRRV